MAFYRLYHINKSSGHIDRAEVIEAEDDVRAVAIVKSRHRDAPVELWIEKRRIMRMEGVAQSTAATNSAAAMTRR